MTRYRGRLGLACLTAAVVAGFGAPAQAAPTPTCDGRTATIVGTDGDDTLTGTDGDDVIWAGPGQDVVRAGKGDDVVCGGEGADLLVGGAGDDRVFGQQDRRMVDIDGSFLVGDVLHGGVGDDLLDAGVDDRTVDQYERWAGNTVSYSGSRTPVDVDLSRGTASGEGTDTIAVPGSEGVVGAVGVVGSAYDDTLTGSDDVDHLGGGAGDDTLEGLGGNDVLEPDSEHATSGDDVVSGGAGDDVIDSSTGRDVQRGGEGDDSLDAFPATADQDGGAGDDNLFVALTRGRATAADGGDGDDDLEMLRSDVAPDSRPAVVPHASLDLTAGTLDVDWPDDEPTAGRVADVEHVDLDALTRWSVIGSQGDDDVDGQGRYALHASMRMGDDRVRGSSADDDVNGGPGDDTVNGGIGDDVCTNTEHRTSCSPS